MQKLKQVNCTILIKVLHCELAFHWAWSLSGLWSTSAGRRLVFTPTGTFPNLNLPFQCSIVAVKWHYNKELSILSEPKTSKQSHPNCPESSNGGGKAKEPTRKKKKKKKVTKIAVSAIFKARCKSCFMLKKSCSSTLYLLQHFFTHKTIIFKYVLLVGKGNLVPLFFFLWEPQL